MGREINEDRIHDLDEKIEEGAEDTIQLKRTRNSLLNISTRIPPEILGHIFRWRVTPDEDRPYPRGLPKDSHNFRLVCHHWFEVAAHTPELWGYWGNTLKKWLRFYQRSGTTPIDLVLNGDRISDSSIPFNGPLRDALRGRAELDAIRSIHLRSQKKPLMDSILSSLTLDGEGIRGSSIELISSRYVDVSKFLARHRFPKLRYLHLASRVRFSPWEHLGQHTRALTDLSLTLNDKTSSPTMTQLLSVLTSNPCLRILALSKWAVPCDTGDGPTVPVPLRYLERLSINANVHPVFRLLSQLEYPKRRDETNLTVSNCRVEDVLGTLGPHIRDHIQRDGRFRDSLGIFITSSPDAVSIETSTTIYSGDTTQRLAFATFTAIIREDLPPHEEGQMCLDLVTHIPVEHVVYFGGNLRMSAVKRAVPTMPKIEELRLIYPELQDGFLQPNRRDPPAKKLLPSLQRLCLEDVVLENEDWGPLLPYLTHQTSDGQRISLTISGTREHICKDVLKEMERLTDGLVLNLSLDSECSFDYCPISEEDGEWRERHRVAWGIWYQEHRG